MNLTNRLVAVASLPRTGSWLWAAALLLLASPAMLRCAAANNDPPPLANEASNITYVSGTCKKATADFNMSTFYNQEEMLVKDFSGKDISGSEWDLPRDGAYAGYKVMFCAPGRVPGTAMFDLIRQKGFEVTMTCNAAGLLTYPAYHVFTIFDYVGNTLVFSDADVAAINVFYTTGGGIYAMTDNCPHFQNSNKMYRALPHPIDKLQMRYNNGISPFPLRNGNPVGDNQFGHHPTFTGIPEMSSGVTLGIPYYDNKLGIGVFAPMCTVVINRTPPRCSGEPASSYVYSHASIMYVDPPVQLVNYSESCNWGRIVHDTAFTRYFVAPLRTGSYRLAANVIAWLVNIERVLERQSSGTPLNSTSTDNCPKSGPQNATSADVDVNKTQVLGCSNGDAVTLKSPAMMCRVGFAGANAPACLALVVTETQGTTCVVDIQNAKIGTYWIIVDGKNSSLQFSVTAASLTPRGTITAVSGTCVKLTDTSASGCSDGSSITIDWTLPYPKDLTLGLGSVASICQSFSVSGTFVHCVFKGINNIAKGRYQTYINGVATGIPLTIQTDIASINKVLCSGSHSLSPQASSEVTQTLTLLPTKTPSATLTLLPTRTPSAEATGTQSRTITTTRTVSASADGSGSMTLTDFASVTVSHRLTVSATERQSLSLEVPISTSATPTRSATRTEHITTTHTLAVSGSDAASPTVRHATGSHSLQPTQSRTWQCVNSTQLAGVLAPYVAAALRIEVSDVEVRNGTTAAVALPPLPGITLETLHIPWFEPWEVRATIRVQQCPNQRGFADAGNRNVPVIIAFPKGLGVEAPPPSSTATETPTVHAVVTIPPVPGYVIFANEQVLLQAALGDMTLGALCVGSSAPSSSTPTMDLIQLVVKVDADALLASAQEVVTPIVAVMTAATPFAAPDLQSLIMVAMMPCSNSYQKRTFAMFRALSVFTLDDSYDGVLWGNLVANVGGLGLHAAVVGAVSVVRKQRLADAAVTARFPSVYLQLLWQLTYASNAFASMQLLSAGDSSTSQRSLAAGVLLVFCVLVPAGLYGYVARRVEATYHVYEYHKWRRSDTNLRVRLLSTFLLPIGRWEPPELRRTLGPLVTLQCRPERLWIFLPVVSPLLVALFSLIRNQTEQTCVYIYLVLAALHIALTLVIVFCKPLRSMIEDWFAAGAYVITSLYLIFSAVNIAYPPSSAVEQVLGVVVVLQVVLLCVRMLYHVSHIFIARRLSEFVPSQLLFEWYRGLSRVEHDVDVAECRGDAKHGGTNPTTGGSDLYAELSELMGDNNTDDVELHAYDVDDADGPSTSDAFSYVPPLLSAPGPPDVDDASLDNLLMGGHHRRSRDAAGADDCSDLFGALSRMERSR